MTRVTPIMSRALGVVVSVGPVTASQVAHAMGACNTQAADNVLRRLAIAGLVKSHRVGRLNMWSPVTSQDGDGEPTKKIGRHPSVWHYASGGTAL